MSSDAIILTLIGITIAYALGAKIAFSLYKKFKASNSDADKVDLTQAEIIVFYPIVIIVVSIIAIAVLLIAPFAFVWWACQQFLLKNND